MRTSIAIFAVAILSGPGLRAQVVEQPPPQHTLSIVVGKGQLLRFGRDIARVVVAEPKIADTVVVSPHEVMVNAKAAGHTTLVIWESEDEPTQYDVTVLNDTTESDALQRLLGAELKSALPETGVTFSGNAETIVLTGKVASADQAARAVALAATYTKKVVDLIQVPEPRQILLQVKFADVDRVALQQIGFNLFSRNPTMLGETSTQQFTPPDFSQLQFTNNQLSSANVNMANLLNLFLFRPDLGIGATIQMMEQQNIAQILAEPNLIVLEGQEASFLAGGEFPYPTITTTPTTGGIAPVVTVQFKKFGVQLNFTPTITPTGLIRLKVRPEVSAIDYSNAVTLDGFTIPAISSRVAETEIELKDGESFAIAGLIDNRVTQVLNKVPWLGDIPILGQLFRSRSTQKSTDELLVVITPRFVKPLTTGEPPKLPDAPVSTLPTVAEQKAAEQAKKDKKNKKKKKDDKQPAFAGPRGYEVPN